MNNRLLHFIGLLLIGILFQSCMMFQRIKVEDDNVKSSKRIKAEFVYRVSKEYDSPLLLLNQKIVKEVKQNSDAQYTVYDLIKLRSNSFKLDDKVFIMVDNEPYDLEVDYYDSELITQIDENRKDVMTSDSTKVSVVTGFEDNRVFDYRIVYRIDKDVMAKIKSSQNVMYRYYAGPDMITIKLSKSDLNVLKKVIEMN